MTTTYQDLRERFINGEGSVTAAELDKARRDAEFEGLQAEAANAAATRQAEADRQAQIKTLTADAQELTTRGLGDLQAHYRTAVDALRALRLGMKDHNRQVFALKATARRLDAEDIGLPADLNGDFEIDRLIAESKTNAVPWRASRLHDDETRARITDQHNPGQDG
jgi:hypothetical protein